MKMAKLSKRLDNDSFKQWDWILFLKMNLEKLDVLVVFLMWIAGIVLAKGFWSTFFAVFFWPWGWYLVAEKILQLNGWI